MDDALRPPTPAEVRMARARLGVTQQEFAAILGVSRQGTISDWEATPQKVAPTMSAARMEELVAAHAGVRVGGYVLDPRSYALGAFSALHDDVRLIAEVAARMAAKVEAAERTLGGATLPSAVPDSAIAAGRDALEGSAAQPKRRRHGGHR